MVDDVLYGACVHVTRAGSVHYGVQEVCAVRAVIACIATDHCRPNTLVIVGISLVLQWPHELAQGCQRSVCRSERKSNERRAQRGGAC